MMRKVFLWGELLTLFAVVPLIYYSGMVHLPKIPILLAFFVICLAALLRDRAFDRRELLHSLRGHEAVLRHIFFRALIVAAGSIVAVLIMEPALLFGFPRARPWLWLLVMFLYPLLSAYPQEVIYRSFLFHRYKDILPVQWAAILASTLAFSFLHIIFDNWIAVVLTIPAGYLFSRTYVRSGSLLLAAIEHGLYGCIVFTSGLGRFFYNPN